MIKTALRIILLGIALAAFGIRPGMADQPAASEYEVKAAFVYNFIKFVEWPAKSFPQTNTPYVIGVLGSGDPFFDANASTNYLDQAVAGKLINERKLIILRAGRIANLTNCHVLFITKSERSRFKEVLAEARKNNILTVSETEDFCQQGGAINFIKQSGKVRFEISPSAAEQAGLKISSKLLNVAKIVSKQPR